MFTTFSSPLCSIFSGSPINLNFTSSARNILSVSPFSSCGVFTFNVVTRLPVFSSFGNAVPIAVHTNPVRFCISFTAFARASILLFVTFASTPRAISMSRICIFSCQLNHEDQFFRVRKEGAVFGAVSVQLK